MPTLAPQSFSPDDVWGFTPIDRWMCKRKVEKYNYGPIYTTDSEKGPIFAPSVGRGPTWGGGPNNEERHSMVVPSNRGQTKMKRTTHEYANVSLETETESGKEEGR